MNRRKFLAAGLGAAVLSGADKEERVIPDYEKPFLNLHRWSKTPVKVKSIELLHRDSNYFLRSTTTDGVAGICRTKQVEDFIPILKNLVIPSFLGKDVRDLESLIDEVYIQNYKLAGLAFWAPVAYVEQSLFDLLGAVAKKPVGALLGGVIRKEIPVYLSGSIRETTAEQEVDIYARGVEMTGAKGVKFKIGGRMSRNLDAYPDRTGTMMKLARKRLGDQMIINADANGSYNAQKAIEVGRMLQDLRCGFFEEPCPWEELSETKKVADALTMPVAGGEQDSSTWRFQWMIENEVVNIVQPDLNYDGGFIRALRVARIAAKHNVPITPHNTQTGSSAVNILQFASAVPNIGRQMEFPFRGKDDKESWYTPGFLIRNGVVKVPEGPGLGIEFDPDYLKKARVVFTAQQS